MILLYDIAIGIVTGVIAGLIVEYVVARKILERGAILQTLFGRGGTTAAPQVPATKAAGWLSAGRWAA